MEALLFATNKAKRNEAKSEELELSMKYDVRVWDDSASEYVPHEAIKSLVIDSGKVYIDNYPVLAPKFDKNCVECHQWTGYGYTVADLRLTPDGMSFIGTLLLGSNPTDLKEYKVAGVTRPTVYQTIVANNGVNELAQLPPNITEGNSVNGHTLIVGYKFVSGQHLPKPVIKISQQELGEQDISDGLVTLSINPKNGNLVLIFNEDTDISSLAVQEFGYTLWPAKASIEFSWNGDSFKGWMKKVVAETGESTQEYFGWQGTAVETRELQDYLLEKKLWVLPIQEKDLLEVEKEVIFKLKRQLSITELVGIAPDQTQVQQLAHSILIENMKWAIEPEWVQIFFAQQKPVITDQRRIELINKDLSFYQDKFAPAYLGWGLSNMSGPGAPTNNLNQEQKRKLRYYLHDGLAQDKQYNNQASGTYTLAYIESDSKLGAYIADTQGNWAQRLYDELLTESSRNQMVLKFIANPSEAIRLINRYSTLLACLQPSGDLASQYHQEIALGTLNNISDQYKLNDRQTLQETLALLIENWITQYIHNPLNPSQEELTEAALAQALQEAQQQLGSIMNVASEMATMIVAASGTSLTQQSNAAFQAWVTKYPKLSKAGKFLILGMWGTGVNNAIMAFQEWDQLSDTQKAELVLSTTSLLGDLLVRVPGILDSAGSIAVIANAKVFMRGQYAVARVQQGLSAIEPNWLQRGAEKMKKLFNPITQQVEIEKSLFGKKFKVKGSVVGAIGVAVTAAVAVLNTIEFVKVLQDPNASIESQAFTGIIAVSSILETVALTLNFFVATSVFAYAAAVFAVVGVIFSLVELFRPKPTPESPVDKFMRENVIPFVNTLPSPPDNWQEPSSKTAQLRAQMSRVEAFVM